MAVWSSIAYAGPWIPAAHLSALDRVFSGRSGLERCGKIEKSTTPSVSSPPLGGFHPTKSSPIPRPPAPRHRRDREKAPPPPAPPKKGTQKKAPPPVNKQAVCRTTQKP